MNLISDRNNNDYGINIINLNKIYYINLMGYLN